MTGFWRLLLSLAVLAFSSVANKVTRGNSLVAVLLRALFAGPLTISSFFFDNELLARVCIDLARCNQLVCLDNLLLLVFLQSLLALVRGQLAVWSPLWQLIGVLTAAAGRSARSRPFTPITSGSRTCVPFK